MMNMMCHDGYHDNVVVLNALGDNDDDDGDDGDDYDDYDDDFDDDYDDDDDDDDDDDEYDHNKDDDDGDDGCYYIRMALYIYICTLTHTLLLHGAY